jgi:hypothetical protein
VAAGASCGHLPPKVPCCASAAMIGTAIPAIKVTAHFLNVLFIALSRVRFSNTRAPANGTAAGPAAGCKRVLLSIPPREKLRASFLLRGGAWLKGPTNACHGPGSKGPSRIDPDAGRDRGKSRRCGWSGSHVAACPTPHSPRRRRRRRVGRSAVELGSGSRRDRQVGSTGTGVTIKLSRPVRTDQLPSSRP